MEDGLMLSDELTNALKPFVIVNETVLIWSPKAKSRGRLDLNDTKGRPELFQPYQVYLTSVSAHKLTGESGSISIRLMFRNRTDATTRRKFGIKFRRELDKLKCNVYQQSSPHLHTSELTIPNSVEWNYLEFAEKSVKLVAQMFSLFAWDIWAEPLLEMKLVPKLRRIEDHGEAYKYRELAQVLKNFR